MKKFLFAISLAGALVLGLAAPVSATPALIQVNTTLDGSVSIQSSKDLSNVVIVDCDGEWEREKFDGLTDTSGTFGFDSGVVATVFVKSGNNHNHDNDDAFGIPGHGTGERFDIEGACDINPDPDPEVPVTLFFCVPNVGIGVTTDEEIPEGAVLLSEDEVCPLAGQDGKDGEDGSDGANGASGVDGVVGLTGAVGPQGPAGSVEADTSTATTTAVEEASENPLTELPRTGSGLVIAGLGLGLTGVGFGLRRLFNR